MLLKIKSILELIKLCPGILTRIKPGIINSDFRYASGLRLVRDSARGKQPQLIARVMLHELHENGHLSMQKLGSAGRQAVRDIQDHYRKLQEERHRCVLEEVMQSNALRSHGNSLREIRTHDTMNR